MVTVRRGFENQLGEIIEALLPMLEIVGVICDVCAARRYGNLQANDRVAMERARMRHVTHRNT
jgi:hypothetical protein